MSKINHMKYKVIMRDCPDNVSDIDYLISQLTDSVFYSGNRQVGVGNMLIAVSLFKKIVRNKSDHKNLFNKISELIYIYEEVSLQLEDIINQSLTNMEPEHEED